MAQTLHHMNWFLTFNDFLTTLHLATHPAFALSSESLTFETCLFSVCNTWNSAAQGLFGNGFIASMYFDRQRALAVLGANISC